MLKSLTPFLFAILVALIRPAASLTCYQQIYTPGISNSNPLITPNQQQQQQYTNYGQMTLPIITCSTTATSCFKFVCFGTTLYTVKGCLDYTQPQYSCQTMNAQCLGGQGECYVCNGNNCNSALSLRSVPIKWIALALIAAFGAYLVKKA